MPELIMIHNLIDPETEETYKAGNLKLQHNIPVGTLVELRWDSWFSEGACWKVHARLWVVAHCRDCDGTPLYSVSQWRDPSFAMSSRAHHGFCEDSLTPVEITDELKRGEDALAWEDE